MENTILSSQMAAAAAEAAKVVSGVPEGTLDARTPCNDWDLRSLLNHTFLWTSYSAERRAPGARVAAERMPKASTAEPGFREDYARQIDRAVQAWADPKAWAGALGVMGDGTPAADVGAMLIMEMVLHGWDVAKATGQEFACDAAVAEAVLDTVTAQAELFRKYQGFADAIEAPDGATPIDRALRLSGRDPQWKPDS